MLAQRDHARAELTVKLARTAGPAQAAATVDELAAAGLLDDARFAAGLTAARLRRGYGPARIAYDLRRAGVDRAVIEDALAAIAPADIAAAASAAVGSRHGAPATRRLLARGFAVDDLDLLRVDADGD